MNSPKTTTILVPDNVIQQLLMASGSSTLEEALLALIETSRTPEGRLRLASEPTIVPILELCKSPGRISSDHLCLSIKLLRNLCAGEITNQNSFIEWDGIRILSAVISPSPTSAFENGILRAVLQVLANVSLAGEMHRHAIWHRFYPGGFRDVVKFRSCKISDPLSMIIYLCCEGCDERVGELLSDQGRCILLEILATVTEDGCEEGWVKSLFSVLCLENHGFRPLFSSTESDDLDRFLSRIDRFGDGQATLLRLLSETMNDHVGEISASYEFYMGMFSILRKAVEIVDFTTGAKSSLPTGSPDVDVLGYSLSILRNVSASDHPRDVDPISGLLSSGIIEFLLGLLRVLEPPSTIRKATAYSASSVGKRCPYKGFRRDVVGIIGNCSYGRKGVQDEIRECDGILTLLQQCVTDEDNAFMREWGIWTVRNVLERNVENQRFVGELEMDRTVDTAEMAELGIRVEFDPESRRPKLVNAVMKRQIEGS